MVRGNLTGKYVRSLAAVCLSVLFSVFLFSFAAKAEEDPVIGISIVYGYRNTAKSGQLLPVTVTFDNRSGDEVKGFLSVQIPGEEGNVSYTSSVSLPEGVSSEQRTVTIPDSLAAEENTLRAVLFDDLGEEIASQEVTVSYLGSGREVLCGILSDNQQDLMYLGGISLGQGLSTKVVTLNPADLPEDEDGLNQLDVIVISSFDVNRLTDAGISAVMNWVEDGGTLVFGTGSSITPLGGFRTLIGSPKITRIGARPVDMGMQYSSSGPDGAVLDLDLCVIEWDGAASLRSSDDMDVVLRRNFGKGVVCITAFDLCDISDFCTEHPGYPQELLTDMIGSAGISRLSANLLSAEERLTAAAELTNTYDGKNIPGILFYIIAAVLFLLLTGPVLFRVLSGRGLGTYYMLGAMILSMFFALFLWLRASATRITQPYIHYGMINEYQLKTDGSTGVSVKGFISLGSPDRAAMTLELPQKCSIRPVTVAGNVSVTAGKKTMLAVAGQNQFETNTFMVEDKDGQTENDCPFEITLENGKNGPEGTIVNTGETAFSGTALIYAGGIYYIGNIEPGETVTLESVTPVYGPVNYENMTAEYISAKNKEGLYEQQRTSLCAYALRKSTALSEGKALLLAAAGDHEPSLLSDSVYDTAGTTLIVVEAEAGGTQATGDFRRVISQAPRALSGSYDASGNVIEGHSTAVLEYSLGSGFELTGLEFVPLSSELDGKYVTAFAGQMAMYNYATASYDLCDAGKTYWTAAELAPYLSPGNNLTVRFIPDEDLREDVPVFLPVPYISGTAADRKPQEKSPSEETPTENSPAENTPTENIPTENTPTENTPTENIPAENSPAENSSAENSPAESTAARTQDGPVPETVRSDPRAASEN